MAPDKMLNKTYGQLCPIARSLDVLGERWTLLVLRELLLGPKRFKELLAVLPAMGTNRLSARLKVLVDNGIAKPATAPMAAYELTELGEQLRKPLLALGLWGLSLPVDERIDPATARAELIALSLTGIGRSGASTGLRATYEFHVGEEVFHIRVDDSEILARSGSAPAADVVIHCDLNTFMALALRQISPADALREGRAHLPHTQLETFEQLFQVLEFNPENLPDTLLAALPHSSLVGTPDES